MSVVIDNVFQEMFAPIPEDDFRLLEENIVRDGCRDPLVLWNGILLDGYNRHQICTKHDIPYKTVEIDLPDREAAADWIDRNQLGRRNLTPDQMSMLRGRRYNRLKKSHGGDRKSSRQNDDLKSTRTVEQLAEEHGVSPKTIERDGQFVEAVEQVVSVRPTLTDEIGDGTAPPKKRVVEAASLIDAHPIKAQAVLEGRASLADVQREIKREAIVANLEDVNSLEAKALDGVYDVIVIDPPWPMKKIERDRRPNQAEFDYPTMTEEELANLTIPAADDCHVWLWTTHKFLPMALDLLDAWGVRYVCTFVWHKPGGFQPIGLPQFNCEFAVYARKGSPKFIDTKAFPACFEAPRGRHSEKPGAFYDTVRRVTAGRRLDMFNRRSIEGFDTWGKEAADSVS